MDLATFRRLAPEALQGRLDEDLLLEWEDFRQANPAAAGFFAEFVAAYDQSTRRFDPERSQRLPQPGTSARTVVVPRGWVFMVMGACVLGATVAAAIMLSILGPKIAERARASAAPLVTPGTHTPATQPEHEAGQPPANALPRSNTPQLPPANQPEKPQDEEPPNPVREIPACQVVAVRGAAFKLWARNTQRWSDGSENSVLTEGGRIKVSRGVVVLEGASARVTCLEGSDLELTRDWSRPGLTVHAGRILLARRAGQGQVSVKFLQGMLRFTEAAFSLQVELGTSELSVTFGKLTIEHANGNAEVEAPAFVLVGTRVNIQALDSSAAGTIEEELRGPRISHLLWDFEAATLPCANGRRAEPGANSSRGALASSIEHAWLGGEPENRFMPAPDARLRLWFKTNAPVVRVSFVAGKGAGAQVWFSHVPVRAQGTWQMFDIALSDFTRQDKGAAAWAGHECHSLQFRMRFDDRTSVLPSERVLLVDDVEIYSPR